MNDKITVVILAAGLGTRMKSKKAKVLHEAGGDTLLNNIIRAVRQVASAHNIVAVIGHQADRVKDSVHEPGIRFALQDEQRGTGHAVMCAAAAITEREGQLLILNGDGPLLRAQTLRRLLDQREGPDSGGKIVTTTLHDPTGYGRIVRGGGGYVEAIVEQKAANAEQLAIREVNPGLYCFDARLFWEHVQEIRPDNPANEFYLTDMVEILSKHGHPIAPVLVHDSTALLGINTKAELALADSILRARKAEELMLAGVTIENPSSVLIDVDVHVGPDTVIEANVQLRGKTIIGVDCRIGAGSVLRDCVVADEVNILPYVVAESSIIGAKSSIGPFTRLRMNAEIGADAHIGNFVELKKTKFGARSKASHLAYLGDSIIGEKVNIGAGTITCNYDGDKKHATHIADGVFVGSNSTLVAPLTIESGAFIAAGSVITKHVSQDALAIGRAHQTEKADWAKRRRELATKK